MLILKINPVPAEPSCCGSGRSPVFVFIVKLKFCMSIEYRYTHTNKF